MASAPDLTGTVTPLHKAAPASGLAELLQFEGDVRQQASVDELVYLVANETRGLVSYEQMFVLRRAAVRDGFAVQAASSLALVDRSAPLIAAIERAANGFGDSARDLDLRALSDDPALSDYPFHEWHWVPLTDRSTQVFGGLLLARTLPFTDPERSRIERIAGTVAHGWLALTGDRPVRRIHRIDAKARRGLAVLLLVGAFFPVRMTALAPVEVVAAKPFVVAAPYAGVIARVDVAPNALVKIGDPVLTFEDIKVRNEMEQARERVAVARAKVERATIATFADADQAREIGPLRAELDLAEADYAYARDLMGKSQIAAPIAGMAIYSDRRDWEGRAVNAGDPVMQIANPAEFMYRIDLPAKEQLRLEPGAQAKIWLDSEPLWALEARVETASYLARPTAERILAFAVTARPTGGSPRIGSRGTAKLYGGWSPFIYTVLRRPIAAMRQYLGL